MTLDEIPDQHTSQRLPDTFFHNGGANAVAIFVHDCFYLFNSLREYLTTVYLLGD